MKLSHLEKLSGLSGVSGDESAVAREIIAKIEGYARWELDPLGNLLVYKEGAERRESPLLLFTPMDEPGLMVTGSEEDGSLKFTRVDETDRRTIPGRRVKVGPDGIPGVIGGKAVHHAAASERDKPAEPDKLRIDIGAANEEEAKALVHLGDTAAFQAEFERLGLHRLKGKALSSRAGCAVLISLSREPIPYDTLFAFTVLREAGEGGSSVVSSRLHPGRAVMVAPVPADDIPGGGETFSLGGGPVIPAAEQRGGFDKGMVETLRALAASAEIPAQLAALPGRSGASGIQHSAGGVRTAVAGFPVRYPESPAQVVDETDLQAVEKLLLAYMAEP